DPVPGEVAECDRRDSLAIGCRERQRRDVADDQTRPKNPQPPCFARRAVIEIGVEAARGARRQLFVEPQAVDLNDAGIDFARLQLRLRHVQREQPWLGTGPDDDACVRPARQDRVNHFDVARRVAEAVTRDIEDDGQPGNATLSASSSVSTGTNRMSSFTSRGSSASSGSLRAGRMKCLMPYRRAASAFSRMPPTGSTSRLSVISAVIATAFRTG